MKKYPKVSKIDQKFNKISEIGTLEELYSSITFVMVFILNTTLTIYIMDLCASFHVNSIICL